MGTFEPTGLNDFRLFEATPGVNIVVRPDAPAFTLVAASSDFLELVGLRKEDVVGKSYFDILSAGIDPYVTSEQNVRSSFDQTLKSKTVHEIPAQRLDIPLSNGKSITKYWRIKNVPVLNEIGELTLIIQTASDITEKVLQASYQAPERIEKAYRFFMNAPVIIGYVQGPDYKIEFANEGLLKVWGKTQEVIGKHLFHVFPELEAQGTKRLLDEVRNTGKPFFAYEFPLQFNQDGKTQTLYFDFVYQPYCENDDGIVTGIISVGHDVTEQIRARQVFRSVEELKFANQKLEEFAYAASHDLKEPVRKILFFSNILKDELKDRLETSQLDIFGRLEKSCVRMRDLIDDLLEYSHASQGVAEQEEINLNTKIQNVLEDLELEIKTKQAKITVCPLPHIRGNKRQLQQLFQNLISNSLKYHKPDETPEITIHSQTIVGKDATAALPIEAQEKLFHLIEVADNGIGFDQKDARKIFDVFTRLHRGAQYKGSGIGLSIVQKVVESHHGFVWATSERGKGAVFSILLPA